MQQQLLVILLLITSFLSCHKLDAKEDSLRSRNDYILILNSHDYDNAWSTTISKRIRYNIEKQEPDVIVSISYAGVVNRTSFLSGRFGMQAAFANGRVNKNTSIPTVLILVGDESWMYYRVMNLRGLWENVPVLLVGARPDIMSDFTQFHHTRTVSDSLLIPLEESKRNLPMTAIMDKENEANTVRLIKQLIPDLEQIVFLSTRDYHDEYSLYILKKFISTQYPGLKLNVIHNDETTVEAVYEELSGLSAKKTAILVGSSGKIPENIHIPVFQLNDYGLSGHIAVGGYYALRDDYVQEATDIALRLHRGTSPDSIPFSYINNETPYLNEEALRNFGLRGTASKIDDAVYMNIPTSFLNKHRRPVLLLSLTAIILITVFLLSLREKRYRGSIVRSMEKYKRIYDEYQIVYENMPMGLAFFDKKGNLLNRNQSSGLFFDKVASDEMNDFNLFESKMLDGQTKKKISKRLLVNEVFEYGDRSLRLIFRHVLNEESDSEEILMIILDYTHIQNEKVAKERIYGIFKFAMDASSLGVAEYNLVDKNRFATDAWYKNLCIDKATAPSDVYQAVVEEDRKKIECFLNNIGEDGEVYFTDTIRVRNGKTIHWLKYVIQLLEYGPEEGRVIIAELILDIDVQKHSEQELNRALRAAKESDRLKNAFIANMSSDIRPVLDELVVLSNQLIETNDDKEKESLMGRIEQNNNMLLNYVERIIELSRTDVAKKANR